MLRGERSDRGARRSRPLNSLGRIALEHVHLDAVGEHSREQIECRLPCASPYPGLAMHGYSAEEIDGALRASREWSGLPIKHDLYFELTVGRALEGRRG